MNGIDQLSSPLCTRIILTFAHFLWQGATIAVLGQVLAWAVTCHSARMRYGIYVASLLSMVLAVFVTFGLLDRLDGPEPLALGSEPPAVVNEPVVIDHTPAPTPAGPVRPQPLVGTANPAPVHPPKTPQTISVQEAPTSFDWHRCVPYAMVLYCLGALILLLRLGLGLAGGQRLRRLATPVDDPSILEVLRQQAQRIGLASVPAIALCGQVGVPTVVGAIKPVILLPLAFASELSPQQIEMLIVHELAHIRRYDPLVNILQRLIEALLFFHPAVWFISSRIRIERENCCDDMVLKTGAKATDYASSLLEMAQQTLLAASSKRLARTDVNATGRSSIIGNRIRRLTGSPIRHHVRLRGTWIIALLVVIALTLSTTVALSFRQSQEPGMPDSPGLDDSVRNVNSDKQDTLDTLTGNTDYDLEEELQEHKEQVHKILVLLRHLRSAQTASFRRVERLTQSERKQRQQNFEQLKGVIEKVEILANCLANADEWLQSKWEVDEGLHQLSPELYAWIDVQVRGWCLEIFKPIEQWYGSDEMRKWVEDLEAWRKDCRGLPSRSPNLLMIGPDPVWKKVRPMPPAPSTQAISSISLLPQLQATDSTDVQTEAKPGVRGGPKINCFFDQESVREALNILEDDGHIPILVDPRVTGPLSLDIFDLPLELALDMICIASDSQWEKGSFYYLVTPRVGAAVGLPYPVWPSESLNKRGGPLTTQFFDDEDLCIALQLLSADTGAQIIAGPGVGGVISADLSELPLEIVLDIICVAGGCTWKKTPYYYIVEPRTGKTMDLPYPVWPSESLTKRGGPSTTQFFDNEDLCIALQLLSADTGAQIIAGPGVGGVISADLTELPLEIVLDIICVAGGCTWKKTPYYYIVEPRTGKTMDLPYPVWPSESLTKRGGPSTTQFFDNEDLCIALQLLSADTGAQIIAGPGVGGVISADLTELPLEIVLDIICVAGGCTWKKTPYYYIVEPRTGKTMDLPYPVWPSESLTKRGGPSTTQFFDNEDLRIALQLISADTGAQIIAGAGVEGVISADVTEIPLEIVLDIICVAGGCTWKKTPYYYTVEPGTGKAVDLPYPVWPSESLKARGGQLMELSFADQDLRVALNDLSDEVEIPIIAGPGVEGVISADLTELPLEIALDMICVAGGCTWKKTPYYYIVEPRTGKAVDLPYPVWPSESQTKRGGPSTTQFFDNEDLHSALQLISSDTGAQIIAGLGVEGVISADLTELPLEIVLDILCVANHCAWEKTPHYYVLSPRQKSPIELPYPVWDANSLKGKRQGPVIDLSCEDEDLHSVINTISLDAEFAVVVDQISQGKLTAELAAVPLEAALDVICEQTGNRWYKTPYFYFVSPLVGGTKIVSTSQRVQDVIQDPSASTNGGLAIQPKVFVHTTRAGRELVTKISLDNKFGHEICLTAQSTDLLQGDDGHWVQIEPNAAQSKFVLKRSCRKWISLGQAGPKLIRIKPGETHALEVQVEVPHNARGRYTAGISLTLLPAPEDQLRTKSEYVVPVQLFIGGKLPPGAGLPAVAHFAVYPMKYAFASKPGKSIETKLYLDSLRPHTEDSVSLQVINLGDSMYRQWFVAESPTPNPTYAGLLQNESCRNWISLGEYQKGLAGTGLTNPCPVDLKIDIPPRTQGSFSAGILVCFHGGRNKKGISVKYEFVIPICLEVSETALGTSATQSQEFQAVVKQKKTLKVSQGTSTIDPFRTYGGDCPIEFDTDFPVNLGVSVRAASPAGGDWVASVRPDRVIEKTTVKATLTGAGIRLEKLAGMTPNLVVAEVKVTLIPDCRNEPVRAAEDLTPAVSRHDHSERERLSAQSPGAFQSTQDQPGNARAIAHSCIKALRAIEHPKSGMGSAVVQGSHDSRTHKRLVRFKFKDELSRSDILAGLGGARQYVWARGRTASAWYDRKEGCARVDRPGKRGRFRGVHGSDFHPQTFGACSSKASIADELEHFSERTNLPLTVTPEDNGLISLAFADKYVFVLDKTKGHRVVKYTWDRVSPGKRVDQHTNLLSKSMQISWIRYGTSWYIDKVEYSGFPNESGNPTSIQIKDFVPNIDIDDREFTLEAFDLPQGTKVKDSVNDVEYDWDSNKGHVLDEKLPEENSTESSNSPESKLSEKIILRLVDSEGLPVSGAKVGTSVRSHDVAGLTSSLDWTLYSQDMNTSNQHGEITLTRAKLCPPFWPVGKKVFFYILHEKRKTGAIIEIPKGDKRQTISLILKPVCHIHGKLNSEALTEVGRPLTLTWVSMFHLEKMSHVSQEQRFEFFVPPGEYELMAYGYGEGARTKSVRRIVKVEPGQSELDMGVIELPASRLSTLIGKPAPEIGPIKAWRNGPPVRLADLHGKVVLLHFGGDSPSTHLDLPKLVQMHRDLENQDLIIIGLYNASSMEALEEAWAERYEKYGGEHAAPFRIAIDGGESSLHEETNKQIRGDTYAAYGVSSSTSVLIDREGTIIGTINLLNIRDRNTVEALLGRTVKPDLTTWRQRFNQVYFLEEGQVLKRIPPPFINEREEYYWKGQDFPPSQNRSPDYYVFHWDGELRQKGMGYGGGRSRPLRSVLRGNLGSSNRFEGPAELSKIEMPGDWIVRKGASEEQKLKALQGILANEIGRNIRFVKRVVERRTIVATGTFEYAPLPGLQGDHSIHIFSGDFVDESRGGGGSVDSVQEFLEVIGDRLDTPIIDETGSEKRIGIPHRDHYSASVSGIEDPTEKEKKVIEFLSNISRQTNLQFKIEVRPVEKWLVTEENSLPASLSDQSHRLSPLGKGQAPLASIGAFLDAKSILGTWESRYGHISSMKYRMTERLVRAEGPGTGNLTKPLHQEMILDGEKGLLRWTCDSAGLENTEKVAVESFDGSVGKSYELDPPLGRVYANRGRVRDRLKDLLGLGHILGLKTKDELKVRPRLEYVAGQPCHVLDAENPRNRLKWKLWFAHEKGMALLKYEFTVDSGKHKLHSQMETQALGCSLTDIGTFWYPCVLARKHKTEGRGIIKTSEYKIEIHEFVPHIKVTPSTFNFQFPEGTPVEDQVTDTYFIEGGPNTPRRQVDREAFFDIAFPVRKESTSTSSREPNLPDVQGSVEPVSVASTTSPSDDIAVETPSLVGIPSNTSPPAQDQPKDARDIARSCVRALKAIEHPQSGAGSAIVQTTYGNTIRDQLVRFKFKGELSRSDVLAGLSGPRERVWARGPKAAVTYNCKSSDAYVGPLEQPGCAFSGVHGRDFRPRTLDSYPDGGAVIDGLQRLIKETQLPLIVKTEDNGLIRLTFAGKYRFVLDKTKGFRIVEFKNDRAVPELGIKPDLHIPYVHLQISWKQYGSTWYIDNAKWQCYYAPRPLVLLQIQDFVPNVEIDDSEFTLTGFDLRKGTKVRDAINDLAYDWGSSMSWQEAVQENDIAASGGLVIQPKVFVHTSRAGKKVVAKIRLLNQFGHRLRFTAESTDLVQGDDGHWVPIEPNATHTASAKNQSCRKWISLGKGEPELIEIKPGEIYALEVDIQVPPDAWGIYSAGIELTLQDGGAEKALKYIVPALLEIWEEIPPGTGTPVAHFSVHPMKYSLKSKPGKLVEASLYLQNLRPHTQDSISLEVINLPDPKYSRWFVDESGRPNPDYAGLLDKEPCNTWISLEEFPGHIGRTEQVLQHAVDLEINVPSQTQGSFGAGILVHFTGGRNKRGIPVTYEFVIPICLEVNETAIATSAAKFQAAQAIIKQVRSLRVAQGWSSIDPLHSFDGHSPIEIYTDFPASLKLCAKATSPVGGNWVCAVTPEDIHKMTKAVISLKGSDVRIEEFPGLDPSEPVVEVTVTLIPQRR